MSKRNFYFSLILKTLANFLVIFGLAMLFFFGYHPIKETISEIFREKGSLAQNTFGEVFSFYTESSFGNLLKIPPPLQIEPVNKDSAIVIEKINVNAPIVWAISVTDADEYSKVLNTGVAHAKETPKPGNEPGNTYLFAHSTLQPNQIERYGAVFTNLKNLQRDDRITIFYEGKRFDYQVKKIEIVKGFDTTPLLREVTKPTLTLQTCHPPGMPKDRLIVTGKLVGVY